MKTPYSPIRGARSVSAHMVARECLYPDFFNTFPDSLSYEMMSDFDDIRHKILDGEFGVDVKIKVPVYGLNAPLQFLIQERWQNPRHLTKKKATITEWNHISNTPSELHKISAGYFTYGIYDENKKVILEAIIFNVASLLRIITLDSLEYERNFNEKKQSYLAISYEELKRYKLIEHHYKNGETS